MDFYQLEDFVAVVEEGSFSRGADRVYRTQSAVSQAIKKLEDELGLPLIDRQPHALVLTEAGQTLLGHAKRILDMRDQSVRAINLLKGGSGGAVTIASHESAAHYVLPELLSEFHQRFPGVRIEVRRAPVESIPSQIRDRGADIGFLTFEPLFRDLNSLELFRDPLVLVVWPEHHLTSRGTVEVDELGAEDFVIHHVQTPTTEQVTLLFEEHGIPLRITAKLWSYENIKAFVKQRIGIAIVPRISVLEELHDGTLVQVPLRGLHFCRTLRVVWGDERYLPEGARGLLDLIRAWRVERWADLLDEDGSASQGEPTAEPLR